MRWRLSGSFLMDAARFWCACPATSSNRPMPKKQTALAPIASSLAKWPLMQYSHPQEVGNTSLRVVAFVTSCTKRHQRLRGRASASNRRSRWRWYVIVGEDRVRISRVDQRLAISVAQLQVSGQRTGYRAKKGSSGKQGGPHSQFKSPRLKAAVWNFRVFLSVA